MCGIVGIINFEKAFVTRKDSGTWLTQALIADTVRGAHSTGVFFDTDNGIDLYKKAIPGWDFVDSSWWDKFISDIDEHEFIIGHNRYATQGKITSQNAHPFQHGPITLVHNGTLYHHHALPGGTNFNVDSEAVCHALGEKPAKEVLESLLGAFALVWHDARDGTINMIRNDERPLYIARETENNGLLIASEAPMLTWLAERTKVKINDVYSIPVGQHCSWILKEKDIDKMYAKNYDVDSKTTWNSYLPTKKNTIQLSTYGLKHNEEVYVEFTAHSIYTNNPTLGIAYGTLVTDSSVAVKCYGVDTSLYNSSTYFKAFANRVDSSITGTSPVIIVQNPTAVSDEKVVDFLSYEVEDDTILVAGPYSSSITKETFKALTKHGCSSCTGDLLNPEYVLWDASGNAYCEDCYEVVNSIGYYV